MVNVIFIDDNYLYQNFPLPKRLDRAALLSIIQLEQYTSIQDLLGTCLYEHLEQGVFDQTLTAEETELFKLVKYTLAMYAAKATVSMLRTQSANTKNEESVQDQYVIDALTSQIDSKAKYINARIVDYIKSTATLKAIATATGCDNDLFNDNDVYQGSVYYPYTPTDSTCE
tara:strand:- start:11931 stop:12443 length:513 start_codon:yes stop_codon:yes gene_type:complete